MTMGCICTRSSNRVRPVLVSQLAPDNCDKLQVLEVENATQRSIRRFFSPQIQSVRRVHPQNEIGITQLDNQVSRSPEEMWSQVDKSCHPLKKSHIARDPAWKTIHIYVASTFHDFHAERAVLATEVFPEIAKWCGSVRMQLVPIDVRRGLSKELETTDYLLTCLREIERCSEDNMPVFFLALLSETLGWVPSHECTHSELDQYDWVRGMSLMEMEIIQAAYRSTNRNAIFMLRESSFLLDLPYEHCHHYMDPQAKDRLAILKSKLRTKFPEQVFTYHCRVLTEGDVTNVEPDSFFTNAVAEFFINRIQKEFPQETVPKRFLTVQNEQQKEELERLCSAELFGKGSCLEKVLSYVENPESCSPLLLIGELGSGKSTIIAKCIQLYLAKQQMQLQQKAVHSLANVKTPPTTDSSSHRILSTPNMEISPASRQRLRFTRAAAAKKISLLQQDEDTTSVESIPLAGCSETLVPFVKPVDKTWHVFYHFVCSIPHSAELRHILQRIWAIESLGEPRTCHMKCEANALAKDILQMLSKCGGKRVLLFIDGIDRIKDEYHSNVLKWIPAKLPENIRVVVSLSPNGETRKIFGSREPKCVEVQCGSLSLAISRQLISNSLGSHNLTASTQLLDTLLSKLDVCNPHYVVEVCNELARESSSDNLHEIATQIPSELGGLYDRIISRLEDEGGGRLVIAALCLLECSHYGLQEPELLDMIGALTPSGYCNDSDDLSRGSGSERHQAIRPHSGPLEIRSFATGIGHEQLGVYPPRTESSLFGGGSPQASQSQLRSPGGATSHGTVEDLEDYSDHEITASKGLRASSQPHDPPKSSPSHSLMLPGAIEASADEFKLSPKSAKKHHIPHSISFPSARELAANPTTLSVSVSPEGSPSMSNLRKPRKLPPSPSLSILSAELAHILRKNSSPSELELGQAEVEIQEIGLANSSDTNQILSNSRIKPAVVGLERMNAIHFAASEQTPKLQSYIWGHLLHQLRPFLRAVGRQGETRLAVGTKALSRAIRKKYFKQPPTQTFPFSFCSSPSFYDADKNQSLQFLASNRVTTATNASAGTRSFLSSPVNMGVGFTASRTGSTMQGPHLVHKRFGWWHARLAGYFATSTNEDRRAEELPYHLARIRDYGRLSHCLVHFPVFERLSDPENVMDLLRFWRCAGGYNNAVLMYHHALDELEISGASGQEMVRHMQMVALFLQKAGETEAAQQILVDAIELEETRLGGRLESMANLTLHMTEILSQCSQQQAQYLEPRQSLESEYRLLQFASRSVEFHRSLLGGDQVEHNLALLLILLSIHLLHYASLGGSAALSARNAQEEAQETAQEAAELYAKLGDYGQLLEAYLHLASTCSRTPRKALEILEEAKQICSEQFGELNDIMLRILFSIAVTLECKLFLYDTAEGYYRKWVELTRVMYGEDHPTVVVARESLANFLVAHHLT